MNYSINKLILELTIYERCDISTIALTNNSTIATHCSLMKTKITVLKLLLFICTREINIINSSYNNSIAELI